MGREPRHEPPRRSDRPSSRPERSRPHRAEARRRGAQAEAGGTDRLRRERDGRAPLGRAGRDHTLGEPGRARPPRLHPRGVRRAEHRGVPRRPLRHRGHPQKADEE
jgi:hypothetical protein